MTKWKTTMIRITDVSIVAKIIHERDDHYSFQTTEPVMLDTLNERLTEYLEQCPNQTTEQFNDQMEDYDDQPSS